MFASPEVGGLPGMEGSPLFSFHPGRNRYYPAAIYLGENDGARFRALDGNVAELIENPTWERVIAQVPTGSEGKQFTRVRVDLIPRVTIPAP